MVNTPPDMSDSSNSMGTWSECQTQRLQLQNSKGKCFGSFSDASNSMLPQCYLNVTHGNTSHMDST